MWYFEVDGSFSNDDVGVYCFIVDDDKMFLLESFCYFFYLLPPAKMKRFMKIVGLSFLWFM